jgi:hypothetical protein
MKSPKLLLLYGFCIWICPFITAVAIFRVREGDRPLFESIMPVVVTLCTVACTVLWFRTVNSAFVKAGVLAGAVWLLISVGIDLAMFSSGPMRMSTLDYIKDIGLTYLIIPAVAIGAGALLKVRAHDRHDSTI